MSESELPLRARSSGLSHRAVITKVAIAEVEAMNVTGFAELFSSDELHRLASGTARTRAGAIAVKEALQCIFSDRYPELALKMRDFELRHDFMGAPRVKRIKHLRIDEGSLILFISLTHTSGWARGLAVLNEAKGEDLRASLAGEIKQAHDCGDDALDRSSR